MEKTSACNPVRNPSEILRKLVNLMEHPISENATERHLQILRKFLNSTKYAFWLHDISYMIRLFEILVKRLDKVPAYKKALECLLYYAAIPPMQTKSSEKLEYRRDLEEYFSMLGYLILCVQDEHLSRLVLTAIASLLEQKSPMIGYCCVPVEECKLTAENSKLPQILSQLLPIISDTLYVDFLNVLFLICEPSVKVCRILIEDNAIELLLQRFEPSWRQRNEDTKPQNPLMHANIPHFGETCCILWKLLQTMDLLGIQTEKPTIFALWSLQYAFRWTLIRPEFRAERNNLLAIILKLLINFPTMDFEQSESAGDILVLAMESVGVDCCSKLKFLNDKLDFQFKRIIWTCLHFTTHIFKEHGLMHVFKEVENLDCELMKIVWRTIGKYVSTMPESFIKLKGPQIIVNLIQSYLQYDCDIEVIAAIIYCLSEILLVQIDDVIIDAGECGTQNIIIFVCNKILTEKNLTINHQKCIIRSFCSLQILAKAGYICLDFIIDTCIAYLKRIVHPFPEDAPFDARVIICLVHLLWEVILQVRKLRREFVEKGGIYHILDIIQMGVFPVKALTLGILADISHNSSSIPFLITWRKSGHKLIPMLMEIFRGECELQCGKLLKIQLAPANSTTLCHKYNELYKVCSEKSELLQSCRWKIHAILYCLKSKFKIKTDTANENYKLYNEKLSTDDELTMVFAENFQSLKMCEIWLLIQKELKKEGITPIDTDKEYLNEKIIRIMDWRAHLRNTLYKIVQKEFQFEQMNELETYVTLKEARLSDALEALDELKFVTNCTERMFQMRKKMRLSQEVVAICNKKANYHRTITNLPFTNIYDQKVDIESTIYENVENVDFELVSLIDEGEEVELLDVDDVLSDRQQIQC